MSAMPGHDVFRPHTDTEPEARPAFPRLAQAAEEHENPKTVMIGGYAVPANPEQHFRMQSKSSGWERPKRRTGR
jgi:hypothetical protein